MSSRWLVRRSTVLVFYFVCAVVAAATQVARGRTLMLALVGALVGGIALMLVIVGILELVMPVSVMRVRSWLMADGPAALDAVGDVFDRGLTAGRDARDSRLRGIGAVWTATGVLLLAIAWRST